MSPPEGSQDTLACPPMTGCSLLSGVAPCQDSGGERESEVHASELLSPPFPIKHEFTEHLLHARLGRAATGSMEGLLCWGADHPPMPAGGLCTCCREQGSSADGGLSDGCWEGQCLRRGLISSPPDAWLLVSASFPVAHGNQHLRRARGVQGSPPDLSRGRMGLGRRGPGTARTWA